ITKIYVLLSTASETSHTPPNTIAISHDNVSQMSSKPVETKLWPLVDLMISIEYMKTFEFFHCLSHKDKLALARHSAMICAYLSLAYYSYENKSDVTLHPDGSNPHNGCVPVENQHERQLHHGNIQIMRDLDIDRKEYALLKVIIICNPG
ncbi:hypothetical protein PENTCL1PPCAC_24909, partial [Pristionchus entomophagus]